MYTNSLGMARKALIDPKLALHDDILATSCVMTLYELFDATSDNLDGWLDHLSGIYRLLQHRGPEMHSSAAAHSVFEHSRYLLMLKHLVLRKACILGQPDWLERPWQDMEKSVEQQVFDQGLRLTSVFNRCDLAIEDNSAEVDIVQLFNDSVEIYNTVKKLQVQFVEPAVGMSLEGGEGSGVDSLSKPPAIMLNITALGIMLGACVSACGVYYQASSLLAFNFTNTPTKVTDCAIQLFLDRQEIARKIIRSVKICMDEPVGAMGAGRMIFSLRLAIQQFDITDPEMEECKASLEQLSGVGHRFKGFMTLRNSDQVVANDVELIQGNARALAAQWQQLADITTGVTAHSGWMPSQVGNLPIEALTTWAK